MRHHRSDVIDRAIAVLDEYGLESLTMRRLAAELGVQPSALYHHVPNKQSLLAAIADDAVAVDAPGVATVQELHLALIHALCRAFDEITGVGSA